MPPIVRPKKSLKMKKAGDIRRSQLITTMGVGAIVDFPRLSGIMAGLDDWPKPFIMGSRIHERNLERMLGKDFFVQVAPDKKTSDELIPVNRFPTTYYCPECHKLDHYKNIYAAFSRTDNDYNQDLFCGSCKAEKGKKVKLIPSRFVIACENGHIDEFPYRIWVHAGKGICEKPQLFLNYKGTTGGLDSIEISCRCGARRSMAGSMGRDSLGERKCSCNMPWLGAGEDGKGWYKDPEGCNCKPRVMQRGANNIYYAVTQSALTIPPWSSKIHDAIYNHSEYFEDILADVEGIDDPLLGRSLQRHFEKNKEEYNCSFEDFKREVFRTYFEEPGEITEMSLREDEYSAFCSNDADEKEFKTITTEICEEMLDYIETIKIVSRLREVKTLKGFRRILPVFEPDPEIRAERGLNNREFSPISKQNYKWLPAVELFGEGIFLKLREDKVKEWERKNAGRYERMLSQQIKQQWIGNKMFGKDNYRYVLLHTLAHLIIRRLTLDCGYSSAAIREKIYSTINGSSLPMSGILIYTSATDTDGSLGGLAREGTTERFRNILMSMLQDSSWCSNDPVCIESTAQGYGSMNYAACHACTLLPETSCESFNSLLDRAAVVGLPENRSIGFFGELV